MRPVALWVLVLLALLRTASAQPGPDLAALIEERTLGVRLKNSGAKPLALHLGWSCSGPSPFAASIDGQEQPFVTTEQTCTVNSPLAQTLAPGASTVIWSKTLVLDRGAHRVQVRYSPQRDPMFDAKAKYWLGEATSPILAVPKAAANRPSSSARLAIRAWVEENELAVGFHNEGPVPIHLYLGRGCRNRTGTIPGQGIFTTEIDGKTKAFVPPPCATPVPNVETLVPGGRLIKWLGKVDADQRPHRIVVRYKVQPGELDPEHLDAWSGELASAPFEVSGKK